MKRSKTLLISVYLVTAACLPVATMAESAGGLLSAKLQELNTRFLEQGDEQGFWQAVQSISDRGDYPILEEIEGWSKQQCKLEHD